MGPLHRLSTSHDLRRAHISTSQFGGGDVYEEERGRAFQLFYPRSRLVIAVLALYMDKAKQQLCSL